MYNGESPEILEKIKAEKIWSKEQLGNWEKFVSQIEIIPKPDLRFLSVVDGVITILQQKYICIVHFKYPLAFGSFDTFMSKSFSYWLNVPTEKQ